MVFGVHFCNLFLDNHKYDHNGKYGFPVSNSFKTIHIALRYAFILIYKDYFSNPSYLLNGEMATQMYQGPGNHFSDSPWCQGESFHKMWFMVPRGTICSDGPWCLCERIWHGVHSKVLSLAVKTFLTRIK